MSDQVSVLVETLSGIYVQYFDYKIGLLTSKVKVKFLISHRILQNPSLSITTYFHGYLFKAT